jgi:hypothetical protein
MDKHKALAQDRSTLIFSEHAYLSVDNPVELLGGWAVVKFPVMNSGHVAASVLAIDVDLLRFTLPTADPPVLLEDRLISEKNGDSIKPGETNYGIIISVPHFSQADIEGINSGKQALSLRGRISYDNGFKQIDKIQFCGQFDAAFRHHWQTCASSAGASVDLESGTNILD